MGSRSLVDFFTHVNAHATAAALALLAVRRMCGAPSPALAVYLVVSGVIVSVLGTWVLAYRMHVPRRFHRRVLRSQLWLHLMPLVLSLVLLALWPLAAGARASGRATASGLALFAAVFGAWLLTPEGVRGCVGPAKIAEVYDVREPLSLLAIGGSLACATALLCHARTHEQAFKSLR